jgi:hypothetical protein
LTDITITRGARLAALGLLFLTLVVGGGNLWASFQINHSAQASRQRAAQSVERKLCTTLSRLTALKPPPGNPVTNPSRAFEQNLHATLSQLAPDLGCPPPGNRGGTSG